MKHKVYKRFTKTIAKHIANVSISYILDDIMYHNEEGKYSLSSEVNEFEENFVQGLQARNFIVTEYRVDIIKKCFKERRDNIKAKLKVMADSLTYE